MQREEVQLQVVNGKMQVESADALLACSALPNQMYNDLYANSSMLNLAVCQESHSISRDSSQDFN